MIREKSRCPPLRGRAFNKVETTIVVRESARAFPWAEKFIEGLFKDPKEDLIMDIAGFIMPVITLRAKHPFSVSSWGRTVKHNKEVGGVDGSDHLLWLGLDAILEPMEKNVEFEKDCDRVGLVALFEIDHYHLRPKGV